MIGFILCTVIVTDINVSDISFGIEFCSPDNHGMALGIGTGKIVSGKSDGLIIPESIFEPKVECFLGCIGCSFCHSIIF